jgi:hypothetical protein
MMMMRFSQILSLLLLSLSHASGESTFVREGLRIVSEANRNTATIFGEEKTHIGRIEASDVSEAPSISPSLAPSVGPSVKGDANNDQVESTAPSVTTGAGDGTDATQSPSISPTLSLAPSTTLSLAPSTSPSVAKSAKPTSQPSKETVPNSNNNGNGSPKDDEEGNSPQYFRTMIYLVSSAAVAFALFKFVQHKRRERLMNERELVIADSNYSYNSNGHLQEFFNDDDEMEII